MLRTATPVQASNAFRGHAAREREGLMMQSRFFRRETEQVPREAGIRDGMQVVDMGCGVGDVSFAVARLVGPTGTVLGMDRVSSPLEFAEERARETRIDNVAFTAGEVGTHIPGHRVDAVVRRLSVVCLREAPLVMRRMRSWLHPGGFMAFLETDLPSGAGAAIALPPRTAAVAYLEE